MAGWDVLGKGEDILIVDDDIAYCDAISEILDFAGYTTYKANAVESALTFLAETTPDIILSDTMMPVTDGSVLLQIVRGDTRLRHIPVVTVSARAMVADIAEAFAAGASGFVAKPFTAAELLAEIGRQLARVNRLVA